MSADNGHGSSVPETITISVAYNLRTGAVELHGTPKGVLMRSDLVRAALSGVEDLLAARAAQRLGGQLPGSQALSPAEAKAVQRALRKE